MSQSNDLTQPPSSDDRLHGNLQKAVDHIRLQPAPAESTERVVERSINRTSVMPLRRRRWAMAFALTQIAAMLIVGILVVLFTSKPKKDAERLEAINNPKNITIWPELDGRVKPDEGESDRKSGDEEIFDWKPTSSRTHSKQDK